MSSYWANFIRTGHPDEPGLPAWPRHTRRAPLLMRIGPETRALADPVQQRFEAIEAAWRAMEP
jgi:para-nitrobenzyl esterase